MSKGRVYDLGRSLPTPIGAVPTENFRSGWPAFCWATWNYLWERKNEYFHVWGPFRFKYRRLRGFWEKGFGKCPFSWKDGPEWPNRG